MGEIQAIGTKENDHQSYLDKNGHEVGVEESVGAYLDSEFLKELYSNRILNANDNSRSIYDGTTEIWEDDWAGALPIRQQRGFKKESFINSNRNSTHSPATILTGNEKEFNENELSKKIDCPNDVICQKKLFSI